MHIQPPPPQAASPINPETEAETRLRTVTRWIAVASAIVALLTQVVQLLAMAWTELPRP